MAEPDSHEYTVVRQEDGRFCAEISGGYIERVRDCSTYLEGVHAGMYAVAKNREYEEERMEWPA